MQQRVPELPVGCENESKMDLRVRVRTSMRASTGVQATQGGGESDGNNPYQLMPHSLRVVLAGA